MSMKPYWKDWLGNQYDRIVEFIKYGLWGGITTAINLLIFFGLKFCGMYYLLANAVGYVIAVIINFILNRKYVFQRSRKFKSSIRWQFIQYILMRLLSLGIDTVLFYGLVSILHLNVYFSRIGLSVFLILATYFISKLFIFK